MGAHWNRIIVLAAAVGLVSAASGSALAAPPTSKTTSKIVVLKVTGDALSDGERVALTDALRKQVEARPSFTILPTPEGDLIDLMFDAECVEPDTACLADIGKAQGADTLVFGEIAAKGGGYELHVSAIDIKTRKQLKDATKAAPAASGLTGLIPDLTTALLGAPPAPAKPVLVALSIKTTPDAADVSVNGQAVGVTPQSFEGKPGAYTIRITKKGFQEVVRKVELKEGAPVDLTLTLEKLPETAPVVGVGEPKPGTEPPIVTEGPEFYETWWFWTIVGAAAAGTTVGILAGTGAFDAEPAPVGNATLLVGQRPDQDFLLHLQRK